MRQDGTRDAFPSGRPAGPGTRRRDPGRAGHRAHHRREGDLAISTAHLTIFFLFGKEGDLFTVRTFYDRPYSVDDKPMLLTALNEWNADTMWPKVYTFTQDNGALRLVGDSQLYIGAGVTREHLSTVIAHWVRFSIKFYRWLTGRIAFETD
ncbi:YbjN domain-containing protein [Microbispora triticiradicis]|nr:YbjN domain-containing protein [Microbispora triticiradicis]